MKRSDSVSFCSHLLSSNVTNFANGVYGNKITNTVARGNQILTNSHMLPLHLSLSFQNVERVGGGGWGYVFYSSFVIL